MQATGIIFLSSFYLRTDWLKTRRTERKCAGPQANQGLPNRINVCLCLQHKPQQKRSRVVAGNCNEFSYAWLRLCGQLFFFFFISQLNHRQLFAVQYHEMSITAFMMRWFKPALIFISSYFLFLPPQSYHRSADPSVQSFRHFAAK